MVLMIMDDYQRLAIDLARLQVSQERAEREVMQMVALVEASVEKLSTKLDSARDDYGDFRVAFNSLQQSLLHIEQRQVRHSESVSNELNVLEQMVAANTNFRQNLRAWSIGVAVGAGITGGGVAATISQLLG